MCGPQQPLTRPPGLSLQDCRLPASRGPHSSSLPTRSGRLSLGPPPRVPSLLAGGAWETQSLTLSCLCSACHRSGVRGWGRRWGQMGAVGLRGWGRGRQGRAGLGGRLLPPTTVHSGSCCGNPLPSTPVSPPQGAFGVGTLFAPTRPDRLAGPHPAPRHTNARPRSPQWAPLGPRDQHRGPEEGRVASCTPWS